MSAGQDIFVCGIGAVSPAGWNVASLQSALDGGEPIPTVEVSWNGNPPLRVRRVPIPSPRPAFTAHPRLRRASPISHYAAGAALEALGDDAARASSEDFRLGVIFCALSGCVGYSRRFYDETLKDPATASPLIFPETVYNSPASHLAALLGTTAVNYTLIGDPGTFIHGLVLAADWLTDRRVDGCLVVGAEEMDWVLADAIRLFDRQAIPGEGGGALYLCREPGAGVPVRLGAITSPQLFCAGGSRAQAMGRVRAELNGAGTRPLLCDSLQGFPRTDRDELAAWSDWAGPRLSVKKILGDGLMAAAAWQCVAAVDALRRKDYTIANISVTGTNQQAIAAQFVKANS